MKVSRNPFSEKKEELQSRHLYLAAVVGVFFALLLFRLWHLQIIWGHEYRIQSESNRTRVQDILPPRGLILDRNGELLVDNFPSYELVVVREDIQDQEDLASRLAYFLGVSRDEVLERLKEIRQQPAFKPVVLFSGLSLGAMVAVETHLYELPGVSIQVKPQRRCHHEMLASHVIGYLAEVTAEQLKRPEYRDHRMGDLAGQAGVEKEWEEYLHGKRGRRIVEVDASGRVLRVIEETNPTPGHNLYLTLDTRLQYLAQEALGDQAGSIVAMIPSTGEVLAMVSMPTFNQSDFVQGISREKWRELIENPLHPLSNRAISGQYPPGSTFKLISAAAILQEGIVDAKTRVVCRGGYPLGDRVFHCWKKSGHGSVDMHRSLKESCDIYYYDASLRLGVDRLALYSRAFGLGKPTGVGLTGEKPGLVPTKAWKKKRYNTFWLKGETLPVIIGQGYNLTTPMQMAQVTAVTANGGKVFQPHLIRKITDSSGKVIKSFPPKKIRDLNLRPETIKAVKDGLAAVVNDPGGTGSRARLENIRVAGKTGTAQVVALKKIQGWSIEDLPYKYRDHAWFVAFAPVEDPQIAVAVLVEHSGGGGAVAAPVAQKVLEAFFNPDIKPAALAPSGGSTPEETPR